MDWQKFWAERRSTVFSGIAALIIIGVGFLAFNSLSQNDNKTQTNKQATQSAQKKEETKTPATQTTKTTTKTHVVASGESLSIIAKTYYNDGNKWTVLATTNSIANPNLIYRGMVLTIPDISGQTASTTTTSTSTSASQTVNQPKTYTVVKGDSLWTISQKFYNGNGYHWVIIRDANPGKVGLLPNGRPLITPGTVLTIPIIPSG